PAGCVPALPCLISTMRRIRRPIPTPILSSPVPAISSRCRRRRRKFRSLKRSSAPCWRWRARASPSLSICRRWRCCEVGRQRSDLGGRMVNAKAPKDSDSHLKSDIRRLASDHLVIATHNPGKLAEMRELLVPYGITAKSAGELNLVEPDENGMTFVEKARLKTGAAPRAPRLPAPADASRLAVPAPARPPRPPSG